MSYLSYKLFMASFKTLKIVKEYEQYYEDTVQDLSDIAEGIDLIVNRRPLLMEDHDVIHLIKGFRLAQGIFLEHANIKNRKKEEKQGQQ